jgi:excinuclease ABC subunit C
MQSVLDEPFPGWGPNEKAMLMKHFGSLKKIRAATVDELSELPGINIDLAKAIKHALVLVLILFFRNGGLWFRSRRA